MKTQAEPTIVEMSCVPKDGLYLLKLTVSKNAVGIIYKTNLVLHIHGWQVIEASAETVSSNLIKDVFIIKNTENLDMTDSTFQEIKSELTKLIQEELDFTEYLITLYYDIKSKRTPHNNANISIYNPPSLDCTVLDIKTDICSDTLVLVSGLLYLETIDIITLTVKTETDFVRYSFLLKDTKGYHLSDRTMDRLNQQFKEVL